MKLLLDACVLYPTVMREVLFGAADLGLFSPLWSDRILEEWARAAEKRGQVEETVARGEIALARVAWPKASIIVSEGQYDRFWLPDPNDIHVLAAAVVGNADGIVTMNAKDFPRNILAEEGLQRFDPDTLLRSFYDQDGEGMARVANKVRQTAEELSGESWPLRKLLRKARLPRLGKALD